MVGSMGGGSRDAPRPSANRERERAVLPNFLIIGAMKSGTSSLYRYVNDHPQVFMPERKELQFFGRVDWRERLEWYEGQFDDAGDAIAVGEASTNYSKYPTVPGAARQIARVLPGAKLVYLIRHPVDRALSQYLHAVLRGQEDRLVDVALATDERYLNFSRYWMQIEQYLVHYPPDQLLVLRSEDLRTDRLTTLQRLFTFLGVDTSFVSEALDSEFYRTEDRRERHPRLQRVRRMTCYRPLLDATPLRLRQALWRRLEHQASWQVDPRRAEISAEFRRELEERLRDDVTKLKAFLGPGFDGWEVA